MEGAVGVAAGRFNLDHISAEIAHDRCRDWGSDEAGAVYYFQSVKNSASHWRRLQNSSFKMIARLPVPMLLAQVRSRR
jgi:hypothetical protein